MTLHWWMHWFWVTANFVFILGVSLPPATVSTRKVMFVPRTTNGPENLSGTEKPLRSSPRNSKAISLFEPSNEVNILSQAGPDSSPTSSRPEKHFLETNRWQPPVTIPLAMFLPGFEIRDRQILNLVDSQNNLRIPKEAQNVFRTKGEILQTRRDTRITWILATNRHKRQKTSKEKLEEKWRNLTDYEEDLKVRPITVEEDRLEAVVNTSNRTLNRSEIFEVDEKVSEERSISQTVSPMLQANIQEVSRERLNRARFSTVIQNSRAADRFSQKSFHEIDDQSSQSDFIGGILSQNSTVTALDIAAITGSCVVMVILISTVTSIGFILYRRKYLNPPQTLNSDKCSNPDSFGYIDDITIRDNSEEMYSLDNDSFLDSLEAMTIQNYWTDSVKHTKL